MGLRILAVLFVLVIAPGVLLAHGTKHEIFAEGIVGVKAMFDTGQPMADSKALIFAPGQTKASLETVTDKNGIVCFRPDKSGTWIIQVREKSGHGMRINLDIDESLAISDKQKGAVSGTTYTQKIIMAICVLWGFIGVVFCSKRKGTSFVKATAD